MASFTWARGHNRSGISTGTADYQALSLTTFTASADTVRRVIVDWDYLLLNSSGTPDISFTVPTAVGLALTTAGSGDPPAPTAGPLTNPDGPWWYWQGAPWRPIGPYGGSGDLIDGSDGRIDRENNTSIDPTVNTTLWLVAEALDGSVVFSNTYLTAYYQVLYAPTGA